MPRTIAVLGGTGPEGFGLALRWARAGENVIIGSRDANRAREAAAKIQAAVGGKAEVTGEENSAACAASPVNCKRLASCCQAISGQHWRLFVSWPTARPKARKTWRCCVRPRAEVGEFFMMLASAGR